MTIDEHIEQAKDCAKGMTFHADSMGWRVTQLALAEEVERLRVRVAELEAMIDSEDALSRASLNGNTASQGEATLLYRDALKGTRALLNR